MYISSEIAERIKSLAKSKKISVAQILENAKLGNNTMANMKSSVPKADNLAKIADELKCSVDYLLGRSDYTNGDTSALSAYYNNLNDSGKEKLLEYAKDLAASGRYADTITVKVAAHGGSAPHEETITKEMAEKLMKAPPQNDKYN